MDKAFWKERYQSGQTGWDLGTISRPLREYFDQLKSKELKILIPGAGNAHEVEYLHHNGFTDVKLLDIAEEPLIAFKKRCPNFPKNKLICGDFFTHSGQYDLIIEQTFFCAIPPDKRTEYVNKIFELLSEKGRLVGLLFNRSFDGGPPFGGSKEEYSRLFKRKFNNLKMEKAYNSIAPRMDSEIFIRISKM